MIFTSGPTVVVIGEKRKRVRIRFWIIPNPPMTEMLVRSIPTNDYEGLIGYTYTLLEDDLPTLIDKIINEKAIRIYVIERLQLHLNVENLDVKIHKN